MSDYKGVDDAIEALIQIAFGCLSILGIGLIVIVPLGIWKLIELLIAVFSHVRWV